MNDFDKKLDFDSNTFEDMKHDMNFVLQRLLGNMIEKQSNEGSMTIKIDVTMVKEFIPNYDPNIKGESSAVYYSYTSRAYSRSRSLDMAEHIGGKKMISEMVETRERIQNEFYEEFENMSQKFIGKPIDASVLYTLERYMEAVAQRISAENGVHIISGKVRANISGTVMVEEPEIEMADGSTRKLSEWFDGL